MSEEYEIVQANSVEEVVANSRFFIGQKAEIYSITKFAHPNGEWSVIPHFRVTEPKNAQD